MPSRPVPVVGDTVRLIAGFQFLTVDRIVAGNMSQVSWNWPTGTIGCATFPLAWLIKAEPQRHEFERG